MRLQDGEFGIWSLLMCIEAGGGFSGKPSNMKLRMEGKDEEERFKFITTLSTYF
jgi:hypothetical protein